MCLYRMSDSEDGNITLAVEEVSEKERYKCEVCNLDFYKRYYSASQNAKALESHLQRQSHQHNVERRAQGLAPEKHYTITAVGKQLGELVDRFGSRLLELEDIIKSQSRRLESLESGSVREWLGTVPEPSAVADSETTSLADPTEFERPSRVPLDRVLPHFQETTRRGLPPLRDWECQSDACSEDTTITDTTEVEYPTLHRTASRRDCEQSYIPPQTPRYLALSSESESSRFGRAMMSKTVAFRPSELETAAVYQYDGNNYAAMVQISNMLERLMVFIKQHYGGNKLNTNLQYIHRTQAALNVQIRQRMNSEPRDAEDTELLLNRFYSVLEHEWND
jgi:hypothetical protein